LIKKFVDRVEKEYRVDKTKEYVTGMIMGGHGTWAIALHQPNRFAAIAPICGDAAENAETVELIKHLPVWAFHGTEDQVVPFDDSKKMVEALKDAGNEGVKFTEYHGGEHDVWTRIG
jgi:predicted peptidase